MKLDWRQGILYATTIGIEGCWLYAILALLNKQAVDGRLSIIGLLLLYPLAFGINKLLRQLQWHEVYLRVISWLVWAAGMLLILKIQLFGGLAWSDPNWLLALPQAIGQIIYLVFRPELLILVSTTIMWWLGRRLAYQRMSFAASVSEFQFGLVILLITFFVISQLKVDPADSVPITLIFFLFALLGISIAHAQEGTSWLSGMNQGHWAGLLLVSISLILILGLLISLVVNPDLLQLIVTALKWVWGLIWGVILKVMAFIASLFPTSGPAELPPAAPMPELEPTPGANIFTIPEAVENGLRIGWTTLMIGFLVFALWRISSQIFGWLRRKLAGMAGAEYEPLPGAFRADFLGLLKRFFRLLRLRLSFHFRRKPSSMIPEIASVRQIYRQLLHWVDTRGYPRQTSQTPHEYLYTLVALLPEAHLDLEFITRQYVGARYGTSSPTEDELRTLRQSWHRIKRNRLKKRDKEHTQKGEGDLNG